MMCFKSFITVCIILYSIDKSVTKTRNFIPKDQFNQAKVFLQRFTTESNGKNCAYILNTTQTEISDWFLQTNKCTSFIINKENTKAICKSDTIFIFVDETEDIHHAATILTNSSFWQQKSRLFFIVNSNLNKKSIRNIVDPLWLDTQLLNFVIILPETEKMYIYNPFRNQISQIIEDQDLFPDKLDDMNGFQFKVSMFEDGPRTIKYGSEWYGKDYTLLEIVTYMLNSTFVIVEPQSGSHDFYGAADDISTNKTDFCFIRRFYMQDGEDKVIYSYPFQPEEMVALVPKSGQRPRYENIFKIYGRVMYISMFCVFIIVVFTTRFTMNKQRSLAECFLDVYGSALLQSLKKFDKTNNSTRFVINLWFYQSLILATAFQACLIQELLKPQFFPNINTITELKRSKMPIYTTIRQSNILPKRLQDQIVLAKRDDIFAMLLNFNTSGAHVLPYTYAKAYFKAIALQKGHYSPFHAMNEILIPGYSSYNFRKRSPFLDKFDECLLREKQYGLSRRRKYLPGSIYGKVKPGKGKNRAFSLNHLQGAFYILFGGFLVSVCAFGGEICWSKVKRK